MYEEQIKKLDHEHDHISGCADIMDTVLGDAHNEMRERSSSLHRCAAILRACDGDTQAQRFDGYQYQDQRAVQGALIVAARLS